MRELGVAAEDHSGDGERSVVGIGVFHLERHSGQEETVLLVGRFDLVVDGIDLGVGIGDAVIGAGALPVAEKFGDELAHLLGIELAADHNFAVAGSVELLVERSARRRV